MNITHRLCFVVLLIIFRAFSDAFCQNAFQNLDFENPILPLVPDNRFSVPSAKAIPAWTVYNGTTVEDHVSYNTMSLGAASISIHDQKSSNSPIQGGYSVLIQSSSGGPPTSAGLGQVGTIPSGARTLLFFGNDALEVTFAGSLIPCVYVYGEKSAYPVMAGDISAFAGKTGELLFNLPFIPSFPPRHMSWLDDIQFSDLAIPEPATGVLLLGGIMAILAWRKDRRR